MNSDFKFVDKFKVVSCIFDSDDILVGLDKEGNWYKKTSKDLQSEWKKLPLDLLIYQCKVMFDLIKIYDWFGKRF